MVERVAEYSNIQMTELKVGDCSFKCLLCNFSYKTTLLLAHTYNLGTLSLRMPRKICSKGHIPREEASLRGHSILTWDTHLEDHLSNTSLKKHYLQCIRQFVYMLRKSVASPIMGHLL